jgi:hypothetical protein
MSQIPRNDAVAYGERGVTEKLLGCPLSDRDSQPIFAGRAQPSFVQKRILCVDDNVPELLLRGKILELQGYTVVLLSCPVQVLRYDLSIVDLAVLDFDMPGMNGKDLLLRMRALHARFPSCCSAVPRTRCPQRAAFSFPNAWTRVIRYAAS